MNRAVLLNCLWYEEITPKQLADHLSLSEEQFFDKIAGHTEFTLDEIRQIVALLGLTENEVNLIFFNGGGEDG